MSAIVDSAEMNGIVDKAVQLLKARLERPENLEASDLVQIFRELVKEGYSDNDASRALDKAEEILGIWEADGDEGKEIR